MSAIFTSSAVQFGVGGTVRGEIVFVDVLTAIFLHLTLTNNYVVARWKANRF